MLDSDNATPGGLPVDAGSASPPGIVAATPVKPTKAISSTRLIKAARSRGVGPVGRARIASSTASARWISSPAASSAGTSARPSGTTRTAPSAPTAATDGVIRASTGTPAGSPSPRTCRVPRSMAASSSPATSQTSGPSSKRDSPTIVTASTTSSRWFSRRGSIDPPFGSDGRRDGTRGERHFRAGWARQPRRSAFRPTQSSNCARDQVFATTSAPTHARRAWETPHWTSSSSSMR